MTAYPVVEGKNEVVTVINRRQISQMLLEEQPHYRFQQHGQASLSICELLAVILGTDDGLDVADRVLNSFANLFDLVHASKEKLRGIVGVDEGQLMQLMAAFELVQRYHMPVIEKQRIVCPHDAAQLLMRKIGHLSHEEIHAVLLNTRNQVIDVVQIYRGTLNSVNIRVGEIFRPAVEAKAAALILSHNHPSRDCSPSREDVAVTRSIIEAGKLLDVQVLDHLVVSHNDFYSIREKHGLWN